MKTLLKYAKENDLVLAKVNYRSCGTKIVGYDLCKPDGKIVISFEPSNYNKNKWHVRNSHENYRGPFYLKKITEGFLKEYLKPEEVSFYYNSQLFKK